MLMILPILWITSWDPRAGGVAPSDGFTFDVKISLQLVSLAILHKSLFVTVKLMISQKHLLWLFV